MKIRPLADKVLVQRLEAENKTTGGIVLPDTAKEKPQQGKVISVGNGKVLDDGTVRKLQVKKGDKILFNPSSGIPIVLDVCSVSTVIDLGTATSLAHPG